MGWRLAVCRPCEIPDGEAGNEIAVTSELLLKVWRLVGWVVNGSGEVVVNSWFVVGIVLWTFVWQRPSRLSSSAASCSTSPQC